MTEPQPALLLLTAWHLTRMRSMPWQFWRARRLDRATRGLEGCLGVHRWISRRSLLLTTYWSDAAAAERWLASPSFRRFDEGARASRGARARVERYRPA